MKLNRTFLTIAAFAFCIAALNTTKAQTEIKQRLDSVITPNNHKTLYFYDSKGNERLLVIYFWHAMNNTWIENTKYEHTYDANDNLTLVIFHVRTWDDNAWIENTKHENTYDANGNQTLQISYTRDAGNNTWIENSKHEYTYDANGSQTLGIIYFWDTENNTWIEDSKYEYTYDANGNQTLQIFYTWDNTTWSEWNKYEYTYDLSFSKEDLLLPNNVFMNNKQLDKKYYTWSDADWAYRHTTTYYWSEHSVGIAEMQNPASVQVYPNPAQHTLYIMSEEAVEQVSIYDINGRELMQLPYPAQSIDINHLANGIYLVKVKTAAGETVKKIVKQ